MTAHRWSAGTTAGRSGMVYQTMRCDRCGLRRLAKGGPYDSAYAANQPPGSVAEDCDSVLAAMVLSS